MCSLFEACSVPSSLCMLHLPLFLDEINIQPHTQAFKSWTLLKAFPWNFSFTCKCENAQVHQDSWIGQKCVGKIHCSCIGALINSLKTVFMCKKLTWPWTLEGDIKSHTAPFMVWATYYATKRDWVLNLHTRNTGCPGLDGDLKFTIWNQDSSENI